MHKYTLTHTHTRNLLNPFLLMVYVLFQCWALCIEQPVRNIPGRDKFSYSQKSKAACSSLSKGTVIWIFPFHISMSTEVTTVLFMQPYLGETDSPLTSGSSVRPHIFHDVPWDIDARAVMNMYLLELGSPHPFIVSSYGFLRWSQPTIKRYFFDGRW